MKNIKKLVSLLGVFIFVLGLSACGNKSDEINVISREDGSGTRGAFVEIVGVEKDGEDATYPDAAIQDGTSKVLTSVVNDPMAIGYISLGSLTDTIKAAKVDGVEANEANVLDGSYKIARPFLFVYKSQADLTEVTKDFMDFVLAKEGQEIVSKGYVVANQDGLAYEAKDLEGKITISGSTSVGPLALQLAEEYMKLNPRVKIEIQETGSGAGITQALENTVDLGMSSRDLKTDGSEDLEKTIIAQDGIAVILSKENPVDDLSLEEIKNIFLGEVRSWEEVK